MRKARLTLSTLAFILLAFPVADALRASFETGYLGGFLHSMGLVPQEGPPQSP